MNKNIIIIVAAYFAFISITAVFLTLSDKSAAKKDKWRVKESTLMTVGLLGGAVAELTTMKIIRHKTKHNKFMIGLPLEIVLHIIIILLLVYFKFFYNK